MRWSVLRGSRSHLRDDLMSRILGQSIPEFHTRNTGHWHTHPADLDLIDETPCVYGYAGDIFSGIVSLVVLFYLAMKAFFIHFAMIISDADS